MNKKEILLILKILYVAYSAVLFIVWILAILIMSYLFFKKAYYISNDIFFIYGGSKDEMVHNICETLFIIGIIPNILNYVFVKKALKSI